MHSRIRRGFTLIELLVVIAILAVLAVVVVLTLNPAGLLQESRDSNRVSDMATLTSAINFYASDVTTNFSLGSSSVLYISLPDPAATSTAGDQCQGLSGLPPVPSGWTYQCPASSTYRLTNGKGWIPINFSQESFGTPLGTLPIDPINTSSSGLYYEYMTNGQKFEVTAAFESQKYLKGEAQSDGGIDPTREESGSSLAFLPQAEGLTGYWAFNEGGGSVAQDGSGNGNNGIWNGTQTGSSSYYSVGKVGSYAGVFDGSTDYLDMGAATSTQIGTGDWSFSVWAYKTADGVLAGRDTGGYGDNSLIETTQVRFINDSNTQAIQFGYTTPSSQWFMLTVTIARNATTTVYLNGSVLASSSSTAILGSNLTMPVDLRMGNRNTNTVFFGGKLDDARIYNRALSAAEVSALYNAEK